MRALSAPQTQALPKCEHRAQARDEYTVSERYRRRVSTFLIYIQTSCCLVGNESGGPAGSGRPVDRHVGELSRLGRGFFSVTGNGSLGLERQPVGPMNSCGTTGRHSFVDDGGGLTTSHRGLWGLSSSPHEFIC